MRSYVSVVRPMPEQPERLPFLPSPLKQVDRHRATNAPRLMLLASPLPGTSAPRLMQQ